MSFFTRLRWSPVLLLLTLLITPLAATAATTSGSLPADETWSGTVTLTGDVTVPNGITLTIQPGTQVLFPALADDMHSGGDSSRTELLVQGSLIAVGTQTEPIRFRSNASVPGTLDWGGIWITWTVGQQTLQVEYCVIEHATKGIQWQTDAGIKSGALRHNTVRTLSGTALSIIVRNGAKLTIDVANNDISNITSGYGISCDAQGTNSGISGTIDGNTIANVYYHGIYFYAYNYASFGLAVSNNVIHADSYKYYGYAGINVSAYESYGVPSAITMENNTIYDFYYGIQSTGYRNRTNLTLLGNSISQCAYDGVLFSYNDYGSPYATELTLGGNNVHNNGRWGVYLSSELSNYAAARFTINNNLIHDNVQEGLYLVSSPTNKWIETHVTLNDIYGNHGAGVKASGPYQLLMLHNDIHDNTGDGVYLAAGTQTRANFGSYSGNLGSYDVRNESVFLVDAAGNFWGSATTQAMDAGGNPKNITRIYDQFDEPDFGRVVYSGWLGSAQSRPSLPVSHIAAPLPGSTLRTSALRIAGSAVAPEGVSRVEVSTDNGASWVPAQGTVAWYFDWNAPADGTYTLLSRAVDNLNQFETPAAGVTVTIDGTLPRITSGQLAQSETWSGDVSLTGDVIVPVGMTLTLSPGTTLRFAPGQDDQGTGADPHLGELVVRGNLVAAGTQASPILMTSASASPASGDWQGIRVEANVSGQTVNLTYCTIENAVYGVSVAAKTPGLAVAPAVNVANCIIRDSMTDGVTATSEAAAKLSVGVGNSQITNAGRYGINGYSKDSNTELNLTVTGSTLTQHHVAGIRVYGDVTYTGLTRLTVASTTITGCGNGIDFGNNNSAMSITSQGNTISQCANGIYSSPPNNSGYTFTVSIKDTVIHTNSANGFTFSKSSTPGATVEVINSRIHDNGSDGVYLSLPENATSPDPVFSLNSIYANGRGIFVQAPGADVVYNDIHDSTTGGLVVATAKGATVNRNNLADNGAAGYELKDDRLSSVHARWNYWGTLATQQMEDGGNPKNIGRIWDRFDDAAKGGVDYAQWLPNAMLLPTGPVSRITSPADGTALKAAMLRLQGIATAPAGVGRVDVSTDGGSTWHAAQGTYAWTYDWTAPENGTYTVLSRVEDSLGSRETVSAGIQVTFDDSLPTTTGTLTASETWSGSVGITGDITVPAGVTLTISPGTVVRFPALTDDQAGGSNAGRAELLVKGSLVAQGTTESPIRFTSDSANPGRGDWEGIRVDASAGPASLTIAHGAVEYGATGISASAGAFAMTISLSDVAVQHHAGDGVAVTANTGSSVSLTIDGSTVADCLGRGVYAYAYNVATPLLFTVTNSTISTNGGYGIYLDAQYAGKSTVDITGNIISGNTTYGIYAYYYAHYASAPRSSFTARDNQISSNGDTGVYVYAYYSDLDQTVTGNTVFSHANGIYLIAYDYYGGQHSSIVRGNECRNNTSWGLYDSQQNAYLASEITANKIHHNGNGMYLSFNANGTPVSADVPVTLNDVYLNTSVGIRYYGSLSAHFLLNSLHENGGSYGGLDLAGGSVNRLAFNNFFNNTGAYELRHRTAYGVDARRNYWGESARAQMESGGNPKNITRIYDFYESSGYGKVDYSDWLAAAETLPTAPYSRVTWPATGSVHKPGTLNLQGIAVASAGVALVEVSLDGGLSWSAAQGKDFWSYDWTAVADGGYTFLTRVTDTAGLQEAPGAGVTIAIDHTLPTTSGLIAADETWSGDVSLTGDVTIPPGVTLTISPGTTVRFAAQLDGQESGASITRTELIVQGALSAAGSVANPIVFTSSSPTPVAGDWYGIRLAPTTGPASLALSHCTVEYATIGVSGTAAATAASLSIGESTIRSTSGDGVYVSAPSGTSLTVSVQDSTITNIGGNGIHCYAVSGGIAANLSGNTISQAGIGIYGHGYGYSAGDRPLTLTIQRNQVHHNRNAGIECKAEGTVGLTAEVTGNSVYSNAVNGVKCWASSTSYVLNAAVTLNDVYSNTGYGIYFQSGAGSARQIFYNSIHENTGTGLQLNNGSATTANFNNLYGDAGLYALQNQTPSLVNARSNYWGPAVTAVMDAGGNPKNIGKIYDSYDSASLGRVDYSEWLAAAVALPTAPLSRIVAPKSGAFKTRQMRIEGVGVSAYGVAGVEVSTDSGVSWVPALGAEKWYYDWTVPSDGTYTVLSRVIDDANRIEVPGVGVTVTIDGSLPTTSGTLSADETWSGTVTVSGDITVPAGTTLTIQPGTVISFAALGDDQNGGLKTTLAELIVNGSLVAQGTAASPIILTSTSSAAEKGDWQGIRFLPAATGSSLALAYVTIENAATGVAIEANGDTVAISISHCTVRHMTEDGVYLYALGAAKVTLEISDSEVYDLLKKGLHCYTNGSTAEVNGTIEGNLVRNTVETGIYIHNIYTRGARARYTLRGNTVQDCGNGIYAHSEQGDLTFTAIGNTVSGCSEGISCYVYYGYTSSASAVQITDNAIHDNTGAGIRCDSQVYYGTESFNLEITGNRVYQNGGDGIVCRKLVAGTDTLAGVLAFNSVHDNWGTGVRLNAPTPLRVVFNNIHENDDAALVNESSVTVDARHNWWGAVATADMASSGDLKNIAPITDYFDNGALGVVNYAEWSASELSGLSGPLSRNFTPGRAVIRGEGTVLVEGVAQAPAGITKVQVSLDNGQTWSDAIADARFMGGSLWSLSYPEVYAGNYTLLSRAVAADGGQEIPGPGTDLLVQAGSPTVLGILAANETWSGTIELEGDVTVPAGVTLTILPGTTVSAPKLVDATFGGTDPARTELIVQGNIFAEGTAAAPILLTSSGGGRGDWYGLRAYGSARLKDITIENGQTGVTFVADAAADELIVQEATVRNNAQDGLAMSGAGTADTVVTVANSVVSGNGTKGISVNTQGTVPLRPTFSGNTVANNGQAGISYTCTPTSGVQTVPLSITGNTIRDNVSQGIYISEVSPVSAQVTIENNTITRSGVNLEISSNTAQASTLNVSGNTITEGIQGVKITAATGFGATGALQLSNNTVQYHALDGIWCSATGSGAALRIEGNTVTDNDGRGVYLLASGVATLAANNLYGNAGYDLYNDSAATVTARGNWWGTTTTSEMNINPYPANIAGIYDYYDNNAKGAVDYFDWLNTLEIPPDPTLDQLVTPTGASSQMISGTKGVDTAIVVNGSEVVPIGSETIWSYTFPLAEGNNAVAVLARTAAGMTSRTVSASIVRDTAPPFIYASDPVNGSSERRQVGVIDITLIETSTAIDQAATLAGALVRDGGGTDVAGEWTASYNHVIFTPTSPLLAGTYTATIHPTDTPLGNTAAAAVSFTVDFTAPPAPVLNAVPAVTKVTPQTIGGTKEAGTAIWMDNVQIVPLDATTTWSYSLTLTEGNNTHAIYARDIAGNKSGDMPLDIILDRVSPTLVATAPTTGFSLNTRPEQVTFTFADQSSAIAEATTLPTALIRNASSQIVSGTWALPAANTVTFTPAAPFAESTYTASMTAYDLAGNTLAASMSFTYDVTAPTAPTLSVVTSPTNLAFQTLSGTKAANSGIWINGAAAVAVSSATTWSYSYHLTAGTNTLNITSRDAAGNESGAVPATIVFDDISPLPVANLTANGDGIGTTVALDWTGYNEQGQGDVDYYQVYVQDHLFTQVSGLTPTATVDSGNFRYTATGLARGATWWCAVVGVDIHGNSLPSVTPVSAVTQDKVAPENATNLRAQSLDQRLVFAWNPSADTQGDLAGYKIYFGADPMVSVPKTQLSFDRSGLAEVTAYTCRVASIDGDGNESSGVSLSVATPYANPAAVAVQPWSGYATVTWSPVSPAQYLKHYAVYASTTPFASVELMSPRTTTTSPTVNVAGLTNDTLYYFAVTAVNTSDGERKTVTTVTGTPVPDSEGPAISDVKFEGSPLSDGLTVTRPGTVSLRATDGVGVSRVEFAVDGTHQATDRSANPDYTWLWNVAAETDGTHTLSITAYDSLGHITQLDLPLTVALAAPAAPVITGPANGTVVNNAIVTISGTAEPFTEVGISLGGSATGSPVSVGAGGSFSLPLTLISGGNLVQAAASNRAGTSPLSAPINVTVDLTLPDPPTYVTASVLPGGTISLSWSASGDVALKGYHVYRSANPFTDTFEAVRVTSTPLAATSRQDLTPYDGNWYYRLTAVDTAGNESDLSTQVHALSDSIPPRAVSVVYTPHGSYDPASGRMGPGNVDILLTVSEPLLADPFLSITPDGGQPIALVMAKQGDTTYTGSFTIASSTPTGTAYAVFSARDLVANRGTEIDAGASFSIDTAGPAVSQISLQPPAPIENSSAAPVTISATFLLSEPAAPATPPTFSYLLSGPGRVLTAIANPTRLSPQGQSEPWEATFTLPADAGEAAPENLSFSFQAADNLGNVSTSIAAANSFQIYQSTLPPLGVPTDFAVQVLPGGRAALTWDAVSGAADYQVYRRGPAEPELTALARSGVQASFTDTPISGGLYSYAVASVRQANSREALSAMSAPVEATLDGTIPSAPSNLLLSLQGTGVLASWNAPLDTDPLRYRLYRSSVQITDTAGLTPVRTGINDTSVTDGAPSLADHWYAVTAVDPVGNESLPSAPAYQDAQLFPVASLSLGHAAGGRPILSWTHPASDLSGFNVYRVDPQGVVPNLKLNAAPVVPTSYTDTGFTGGYQIYAVTAVDAVGQESPARQIVLPDLTVTRTDSREIQRGLFNRLDYRLQNSSSVSVSNVRLEVSLNQVAVSSETFSLAAGGSRDMSLLLGGDPTVPDVAELAAAVKVSPASGELVSITSTQAVSIGNGVLGIDLLNDSFTRGGSGAVRFVLTNTGAEEIEVVTAKASGAAPSNEVVFSLLDPDGNVLSSKPLQQTAGTGVVLLPGGDVVARIPAGASFTSDPVTLGAPLSSPDSVRLRLAISKVYYHRGQADQASIAGLSSERPITLMDTDYFGEVLTVNPPVSYGSSPVAINGRAVKRVGGQPSPAVPLDLVISVGGFYRTTRVTTDATGSFSYTFVPNPGESGLYTVAAVHPDLKDRPVQAQFTINSISVTPADVNLTIPRNYEKEISLRATTGSATTATNLRLVYRAEDQQGGVLPPGIHVTPGPLVARLDPGRNTQMTFKVWGDNEAADIGRAVIALVSDELSAGEWAEIRLDAAFSGALPSLVATPSLLETGLGLNQPLTETVVLENLGTVSLTDVTLSLKDNAGAAAPSWVKLTVASTQGSIAPGEKRSVGISFTPTSPAIAEGMYAYVLHVESSNDLPLDVPLSVVVTQSGIGNVLLKVSDNYTGTFNQTGQLIQGLAGARITLRHSAVGTIQHTMTSDAYGEALFVDLPAGDYTCSITAPNHEDYTGTVAVRPGVTSTKAAFLVSIFVTVSWDVKETTIPDVYNVITNLQYQTNVPAAVVVAEPSYFILPKMNVGDVFTGQYRLTNYGLIRADNLVVGIPKGNAAYQWEIMTGLPSSLNAGQSITVAFRITKIAATSGGATGGQVGGDCQYVTPCHWDTYEYKCPNGETVTGLTIVCAGEPVEQCIGDDGNDDGWWNIFVGNDPCMSSTNPPCSNECGCSASKSYVDNLRGQYNDDPADMKVKVPGGFVEARRYYEDFKWEWEHDRSNLKVYQDGNTIESARSLYRKSTSDPTVFVNGTRRIRPLSPGPGYRWEEKDGTWKEFTIIIQQVNDNDLWLMTSYGDRNGTLGNLVYAQQVNSYWANTPTRTLVSGMLDLGGKHVVGVTDRGNRPVLTYEYDENKRKAAVVDPTGRRVDYLYTNGRLSEVASSIGDTTTSHAFYAYNSSGRLNEKTDAEGRKTFIQYYPSGNVKSVLDQNNEGTFYSFEKYANGEDGTSTTITTSSGKVEWRRFNKAGEVTKVRINGKDQSTITRTSFADRTKEVHADEKGNTATTWYDTNKNKLSVVSPDGTTVIYSYEQPDPRGISYGRVTETKHLDASGRILRIDTNVYKDSDDTSSRRDLLEQREGCDASGGNCLRVKTYADYTEFGEARTVTVKGDVNSRDVVRQYTYDDATGNLSSVNEPAYYPVLPEDPPTLVTTYSLHDSMGNARTRTDIRGMIWSYGYDHQGHIVSEMSPEPTGVPANWSRTTNREYDFIGNLKATVVGVEGRVVRHEKEYDLNNNLTKMFVPFEGGGRPAGLKFQELKYNTDNLLYQDYDEERNLSEFAYNNDGRRVSYADRQGNLTKYLYYDDPEAPTETKATSAQLWRIEYPRYAVEYEYDEMLRIKTETTVLASGKFVRSADPSQLQVVSISHANAISGGLLITRTDEEGRAIAKEYDRLDRLVKVTRYDTGGVLLSTIQMQYDPHGNLRQMIDPRGGNILYGYDSKGRLLSENRQGDSNPFRTYFYDDLLGSVTITNGGNGQIVLSHDVRGRLTAATYKDSLLSVVKTVQYGYNEMGSLVHYVMSDAASGEVVTSDITYDIRQRKVSEEVKFSTLPAKAYTYSYSYYANGRKAIFVGPDGYEHRYDNSLRLQGIDIYKDGALRKSIAYPAYVWQQPAEIRLPGGTTKAFGYDPLMRFSSVSASNPSAGTIMDEVYSKYWPAGDLNEKRTPEATYTYGYDDLYRLTSVLSTNPLADEAFTYDINDNRATQSGVPGVWNYNAKNELENFDNGNNSFVHDEAGNMVSKNENGLVTNYHYDEADQLARVERADGSVIAEYGYDPFGRRIWKDVGGIKAYFLYSDEGLVAELDSAGAVIRTYGYEPGSVWSSTPIYQKDAQGFLWYLNDRLGTPVKMVDDEGIPRWAASYEAFGSATVVGATRENNLRFPGQYYDLETGLHYNWHRYYDPQLGRFLQADPVEPRPEEMNAYAYALNNPIMNVDPSGQMAACIAMTVTSLAALPPGWIICSVVGTVVVGTTIYYNILARADGSTEAPGKPPNIEKPPNRSEPGVTWALCYANCIARFGYTSCAKAGCAIFCTLLTIKLLP
ncbi:MAG: right-handed parallel beta-helix repeat-containing protein [Candidatus Geothermincolia bacterium]